MDDRDYEAMNKHNYNYDFMVNDSYMDLKLVKIASVREHMDSYYRGEISYSKAVDLINDDANKQLALCNVIGRSEQLCENLDKNLNCKNMCLTHCIDGNKFWK